MQCPRCQQDNPSHAKFCLECGTPLESSNESDRPGASYALLQLALSEALERENASSEILRVISSSPNDLASVFDTILDNVLRLCEAQLGVLFLYDGDTFAMAAHRGVPPDAEEAFRRFRAGPTTGLGRMLAERQPVHIPDIRAEEAYRQGDPLRVATADLLGARTFLAVPLLKDSAVLGAGVIYRREVRPFGATHIALLQTFADQAAIAVENVRLFTELEARNRDLIQALEQQTATAEVLGVIGSSPTDAQPVFEAIVRSAWRLLGGFGGAVYRLAGDEIHLAAYISTNPSGDAALRNSFPRPLSVFSPPGEAMRRQAPVVLTDIETDEWVPDDIRKLIRERGDRSGVWVPMMREGVALGAIGVTRSDPGGFGDEQIALLKTFADQAVIAIENVRLFNELEARNKDLGEALERQTATADILRAISQAQTDVQPVFEVIADSAMRLFGAWGAAVVRYDGEMVSMVAARGGSPGSADAARERLQPPHRPTFAPERTVLTKRMHQVVDVETDPSCSSEFRHHAAERGFRSFVAVPMLQGDVVVGVIAVTRAEPGSFTHAEIALLQTFADQAVIAIENARLLGELRARTGELTQSVEQLTALGEVSRAVTSTLDVETVLETVVSRARQLTGADGCLIYEYDEATEQFHVRATDNLAPDYVAALRGLPLRKGEGVSGRAAELREPVQVVDITTPAAYESSVRDLTIRAGYRAALSVPLLREEEIIGSLILIRKMPGEFPPEIVEGLRTFATQSALAIQNARLFREIADKSAQLEAASRHKSEFLANMSHELRTPLNAIIGFSEVLTERMFGELNEKQDEYLKDIYASGQHLLSLINDILDLSKIEAGRMELEATDFDLPTAIENALILVRERASRRGITLGHDIDERLGAIRGDERKVKQVLLNLLSNALKFTPEGGRIDVRAAPHDGVAEISVTDTGVGIALEDQEAVFEEFRQVGVADKKVEGTGLGLALSRKFIELHGGRIWVKSQVGHGSTFTFTLPVRPWPAS
jgi:signal transduction histidine kinase